MAQYPVFFEAIILVALLDYGYQRQQYKSAGECGKNKILAREMAQTITARQCDSLSDIGIAKAAIESLWLKFLSLLRRHFLLCSGRPHRRTHLSVLLLTSWQWHYRTPAMTFLPNPYAILFTYMPPAVIGGLATLIPPSY